PALSEHAVRGEMGKLKEDFSFALRLLFFITVPSMVGLMALKVPIVHALFQRGKFGYEATLNTADALVFYSLGIWAVVGARVAAATFYSLQDTKTPVKVAALAMVTNIGLSFLLMGPLKHNGLALANALASTVNFTVLFFLLRRKVGGIGTRRIVVSFIKIIASSAVMGIAGHLLSGVMDWQTTGNGLVKALFLGGMIAVCGAVYVSLSYLLKSEEMVYLLDAVKKRKGKRRNSGD
ncbi:MAG: murein biosynthesis integral membrane protein MurJ, partial [Nitrospirales bacterium]|nr:murein biosynthesis integral membrane protein MurJ [Nitrospirales bacterium]